MLTFTLPECVKSSVQTVLL